MRHIVFFVKKMLIIELILVIILSIFFNIVIKYEVHAATYTQEKKLGIESFPESYQEYLKKLKELHPNWNFTAFYTGMTWNDFISNETGSHLRNTVHKSSEASWKDSCNKVASGYACASKDIVMYFADPRNFLTESGIFQFIEMSYNSSIHTKAGVESIIKGSFMDKTINVAEGQTVETPVKAKQNGQFIMVTPGTTNSEVASTLGIKKYKVTDSNGKTIDNSSKSATGYKFTNTEYDTSYTMIVLGDVNGDSEIEALDYIRVRNYIAGRTTMSVTAKLAADVNNDGEIEALDYIRLRNHIAGRTSISVIGTSKQNKEVMSYADIIIKAAEESGISPYSIAIKIFQEVGRNGSNSVTGTYPGYEGYYNFFNFGAYDGGNAIENGLKYAKEKGWNSQYRSIVEGAKLMADSYISVGQNTAYFYKFDVIDEGKNGTFWHQYMTNIQDPSSQATTLYNTYAKNNMLDLSLNFVIPVYNDMPGICGKPNGIDSNAPNSYYVNGTGVNLRSEPTTSSSSIGTLSINEIVTVEELNAGEANGYTWAKIKRANGTIGYIANKYLTKCN